MADKPLWMDYVDLAAKIAVPIVVVAATLSFNISAENRRSREAEAAETLHQHEAGAESEARRRQYCVDVQFRLVDAMCRDDGCTLTGARAAQVLRLSQLTNELCNGAVPASLSGSVARAVAATGDANTAGQVAVALGVAPSTPQTVQGPQPLPRIDAATQTLAPRIYVQIARPDQRAGAEQLIARVNASRLEGQEIIALGPDLVQPGVSQTQLRCLRASDCRQVTGLAAFLSVILGSPVAPVNLSERYEHNNSARPNHFELWFAPGPIQVQPLAR